jgi:hypothetical protein
VVEPLLGEAPLGGGQQRSTDAPAPGRRVHIEREQLSVPLRVTVPSGGGRGEPADGSLVDRNDRVRLSRIPCPENVAFGTILRAQAIEVLVGKEAPVTDLPGPNVDRRDLTRIGWFRGPKLHDSPAFTR